MNRCRVISEGNLWGTSGELKVPDNVRIKGAKPIARAKGFIKYAAIRPLHRGILFGRGRS